MTQPVITVERLSKAYRIGLKEEVPDTLAGAVVNVFKAPFRNWRRLRRLNTFEDGPGSSVEGPGPDDTSSGKGVRNLLPERPAGCFAQKVPDTFSRQSDTIWALRDVSFEVTEGEVVGIIGRNGAGKSTLLKVLSRITEPTSGRAVIRGRVSSLLEVGTGFHPELSGRENIYMNGTILGMTKREIDRKFDEIVEFSGVEQFLDTPVKRYSSGMSVRLAFAVAAHLEPEILIIDEVLAVGDAEFQKKCLGKMQDVAAGGRTVLFVSHNMGVLQKVCSRAILLAHGEVALSGPVTRVVQSYLRVTKSATSRNVAERTDRKGTGRVTLVDIQVSAVSDTSHDWLVTGQPANFHFFISKAVSRADVSFVIHDQDGSPVAAFHSKRRSTQDQILSPSRQITCQLPELPLLAGRYSITAAVWLAGEMQDYVEHALELEVENGPFRGRVFSNPNSIPGCVCIDHIWSFEASVDALTATARL